MRNVRKQVAGDADAGQVGGVVERGERRQPVDRGEHLGIDEDGAGEVFATHDDAVPDRHDVGVGQPWTELVEQCEHGSHGLMMCSERLVTLRRRPVGDMLDAGHLLADALDDSRRQARAARRDRPART